MNIQHKELARGKWNQLSLLEQLSNVGSEVIRAMNWKNKNGNEYALLAIDRALELLDLTLADSKNIKRLREIARLREALVDYFYGENIFHTTDESWRRYFLSFNYAARL